MRTEIRFRFVNEKEKPYRENKEETRGYGVSTRLNLKKVLREFYKDVINKHNNFEPVVIIDIGQFERDKEGAKEYILFLDKYLG